MKRSPSFRALLLFGALFALGSMDSTGAAEASAAPLEPRREFEPIDSYLRRFQENPVQVMNEALPRYNQRGEWVDGAKDRKFSISAIENGEAVRARDHVRALKMGAVPGARSGVQGNDRAETLVGMSGLERSLTGLEERGLTRARLVDQPWSDDYWGFYKGILGARYGDPGFPAADHEDDDDYDRDSSGPGLHFGNNFRYYLAHPATRIVQSGDPAEIDKLSPSEKYDLLIGDGSWGLTQRMWNLARRYSNANGFVAIWMGICHGWAAASYSLPRPARAVTLKAANGRTDLRFYPSDIKALASLLYAQDASQQRFTGGRCGVSKPAQDANGRVVTQECFDNNPGTWHLAVTHQIGLAKRSFVLDATYDYEVWNQPVLGYRYTYFNPQTGKPAATVSEARVAVPRFTQDKFRPYRSPHAASVVGISMELTYIVENSPSQRPTDGPEDDFMRTVRYVYDLELDANGRIIGGEWYNNRHPDFLWTPAPGWKARSVGDAYAQGSWDPSRPLPPSWRQGARAAQGSMQPLSKILDAILETMAR